MNSSVPSIAPAVGHVGTVTCTLDNMTNGARVTITITVKV